MGTTQPTWQVRVRHIRGQHAGQVDLLPAEGGQVGREQGSAVHIGDQHTRISRRHLQIWTSAEGVWIRVLGSAVSTTINGAPLTGVAALHDAAELDLGDGVLLRVEIQRPGPPERAPELGRRPLSLATRRAVKQLAALGGLVLVVLGWAVRTWSLHLDALAAERALARDDLWQRLEQGEDPATLDDLIQHALTQPVRTLQSEDEAADPLTSHIQLVLEDLIGQAPKRPVDSYFRDAVRKQLPGLIANPNCGCRLAVLRPELERIFSEELERIGVPTERARWLVYIPWIESCYKPEACSPAAARGMWQFIPKTANRYGLAVNDDEDERCDWRASTRAAARYFSRTFAECGHSFPMLAIAAYNAGEARACAVARDETIPEDQRDLLAFYTHGYLRPETFAYVPRFVAATFLDQHPEEAYRLVADLDGRTLTPASCTGSQQVPPSNTCPSGQQACPVTKEEVSGK